MTKITNKSASRKAAALAKKLDRMMADILDLRHEIAENLPPTNSEQELVPGAITEAYRHLIRAHSELVHASVYVADTRTEEQIKTEQDELRKAEARAETIRRYGCAA